MGAKYLARNVAALATEGRLVIIGMQGGGKGELDLGALLPKRGAVIATSLRSRPAEEKAAICAAVGEHVWPLVGRAVGCDRSCTTGSRSAEVARAHQLMDDSGGTAARSCSRRVGRVEHHVDTSGPAASRPTTSW